MFMVIITPNYVSIYLGQCPGRKRVNGLPTGHRTVSPEFRSYVLTLNGLYVGALIIGIGFWGSYTIAIIKNRQYM